MPPENIAEAIAELRAAILEGDDVSEALEEVSKEYDIPEDVLRVRFEKGYGFSLEDLSWIEVQANDRLREAVDSASKRYDVSLFHQKHVGRRFWYDGEWYRYICQSRDKIIAVKESTRREWWFTGDANFERILAQIGLR